MNTEKSSDLARRAAVHAALADQARLRITDTLAEGDASPSELGELAALHWSVPDPVPSGDPHSFDAAVDELSRRVGRLAPRVAAAAGPRP